MDDFKASLVEHLDELRKRIIVIAIALVAGALISYQFIDVIVEYIVKPADNLEFIYLSPPELFTAYVKMSLIAGGILASPIIIYHIWAFLKPGLKPRERKYLLVALFMGIIFFLMGISFSYYIIIPMTIRFFLKMSIDQIAPMFSFANYIGFVGTLLLSFGIVFELPLLILLLTQLNLVTPKTFKQYRKIFILVIFVVAAVLTPPDVVSQMLMALPMIVLYEFSISLSTIIEKRKKRKSDRSN